MKVIRKLLICCGALLFINVFMSVLAMRIPGNLCESVKLIVHHYVRTMQHAGEMETTTANRVTTPHGILVRASMKEMEKIQEWSRCPLETRAAFVCSKS